jgi:hypothetical protein
MGRVGMAEQWRKQNAIEKFCQVRKKIKRKADTCAQCCGSGSRNMEIDKNLQIILIFWLADPDLLWLQC